MHVAVGGCSELPGRPGAAADRFNIRLNVFILPAIIRWKLTERAAVPSNWLPVTERQNIRNKGFFLVGVKWDGGGGLTSNAELEAEMTINHKVKQQ